MGFIASLKNESKEFGVSIWKLPDFILISMGLANGTVMILTYIWASNFAGDPREAVVLVAAEAAIIMVIGNVFVESAKHIIEVSKLKKEFIQIISHQIRSPLTTMRWQIELLQRSGQENFTANQKKRVNKIFEENEKITMMVNDILNMARTEKESDEIVISDVIVEDLIEECIHMFDELAKFRKVKIDFHNSSKKHTISVDSEKFKIVIANLLENAISYSSRGCVVTIKTKQEKNNVGITIKDQGIGIEKTDQKLIFNKFYRGSNGKKMRSEGTGLGLFMAKKIVERMKGSITFKSKLNKGTKFRLFFPLKHIV